MADIVKRNDYSVTGWDPFRAMRDMLRWDPFLRESFFQPTSLFGRGEQGVWAPMFEVRENGSAIRLVADLPGIRKEDVEINLIGNTLTIAGKREAEERHKDEQFHTYERSFGQFTRSFTLPEYADIDHITSNLSDGVLTVVVPKSTQSKSRRITIGGPSTKS